jgi:hypothetical protein
MSQTKSRWWKIGGVWEWRAEALVALPPAVALYRKSNPDAVRGPGYYAWKEGDGGSDATGPYETLKEAKAAALGKETE